MPDSNSQSVTTGGHGHGSHKQRIGNYVMGSEIGRGSFATVYKGYRSKTKVPVAIKAVSRQKLTAKLLENLESEINILKVINHRNIVALTDCFKNDTHIYLVMEYCSGSDLSIYIKQRGKLSTLDFVPRFGTSADKLEKNEHGKVWWPHPSSGGLDENITRSFLGQLAQAIKFLRQQNLMHRDIKPQNLLLQPATEAEVAEGHPYGIPVLKVADFGFARILPAAAMAETLCGSPLYMAPEILRYEKYDAKADLWSVGAVLFEMSVGRPPFRASNHVELLRRIERGNDQIIFPDEKPQEPSKHSNHGVPTPVSPDIKALIRSLLKRKPNERMGFDDFFTCGVWDGHMGESTEEELSLDVSTDSSSAGIEDSHRIRNMVASIEQSKDRVRPLRAPQPLATDAALNPQPAMLENAQENIGKTTEKPRSQSSPSPSSTQPPVQPTFVRRSTPKYYVGNAPPSDPVPAVATQTSDQVARQGHLSTQASATPKANPRPIMTAAQRRLSGRSEREREQSGSVEEATPLTPSYSGPSPTMSRPARSLGEGSPLAATPPITMGPDGKLARESALEGSGVGTDYVVVEKQTVEINALADELDQASTRPIIRRSSRSSVVSRPVSSFQPASPSAGTTMSTARNESAVVPLSYSPPFAISSTPPFAMPTRHSPNGVGSSLRHVSNPSGMNVFPPNLSASPSYGQDVTRYSASPSSLQTGALARALTTTAIKLIGSGANQAATVIARATAKRRPTIMRVSSDMDPAEDDLLHNVEDIARKAFVLFELADERLLAQSQLAQTARSSPTLSGLMGTTPPFSVQAASQGTARRKSSSSSINSEVWVLRQQEAAANDAVVLYMKSLTFIARAMDKVKRYWKSRTEVFHGYVASQELNEMGQWLRARFNEVYEKAEWAKHHAGDNLLFPDWLVHDKARDISRQAASAELQGELFLAEQGYETALWLLQALLDESVYENGRIAEDDRVAYEKLMVPIKIRLDALRKKLTDSPGTTAR
ncbi:serine/threonine-protein kinase ATG1 [Cryptococcus depauperatus]|nr:ULK/ULK protein kinase [Cryptococcus depauperatus CBS 7855]